VEAHSCRTLSSHGESVNGENEQGQNRVYGMVHHCTGAGVKSRNVFNIVDLAGENSMCRRR
jgi:hypothetical protein